MPAQKLGSVSPLIHQGEVIGHVLRSRRGCKPVFVSVGHRVTLQTATRVIAACLDRYRVPRPTREADLYVGRLKAKLSPEP